MKIDGPFPMKRRPNANRVLELGDFTSDVGQAATNAKDYASQMFSDTANFAANEASAAWNLNFDQLFTNPQTFVNQAAGNTQQFTDTAYNTGGQAAIDAGTADINAAGNVTGSIIAGTAQSFLNSQMGSFLLLGAAIVGGIYLYKMLED